MIKYNIQIVNILLKIINISALKVFSILVLPVYIMGTVWIACFSRLYAENFKAQDIGKHVQDAV